MKTFSILDRESQLLGISDEVVDLLIIGGGITGAGIALDAAARGLSVVLVEMQDFASGTSSRSTKLVHGGLRYLKQFEIKEVAELGRERAIVYENGPHVTTPVWMLLPFHIGGTFGRLSTSLGLKVYDLLAGVKRHERRYMLTKEKTLEVEPLVKKEGLLGGGMYVEYRTDDARLTIEVIKAANDRGAHLFNYMQAVAIDTKNLAFTNVTIVDLLTGINYDIKAKKVVNAAGPWVDRVRALDTEVRGKHLILSKGVHLVFDASNFPLNQAVYFDTPDGRMVFAIPRAGKTYVGTTDTFYEGDPQDLRITDEDTAYILQAIAYMFPTLELSKAHIESGWVGVRPLIHEDGKSPSEISRKDEIWQSEHGVITIAGGKLTGYRKMAEKIVDLICQQLEEEYNKTYLPCITKHLPISGGDLSGSKYFEQYVNVKREEGEMLGLAEDSEKLARLYGTNTEIVHQYVREATGVLPPVVYGQLMYSIYNESVAKPVDFFIRRTAAMFFNISFVEQYKDNVIEEMSAIFKWSAQQKQAYLVELEDEMRRTKAH
ncbi:glycerol-3-phosphate dehydrogenase/oxidase [Solibacillus sp. CAU 1738]|uniref:glycerol-3-phosphate dehydrogenase/oxidase n=1 Tax=Solibacillus sp. CAU 1738 TaxID=3140363 RepID=UPI00326106DA